MAIVFLIFIVIANIRVAFSREGVAPVDPYFMTAGTLLSFWGVLVIPFVYPLMGGYEGNAWIRAHYLPHLTEWAAAGAMIAWAPWMLRKVFRRRASYG